MHKKTISIFFLVSFTIFMVTPTVMSILDRSYDVSFFYSLTEEENKNNETLKKFEFEVFDFDKYLITAFKSDKEDNLNYCLEHYTTLTLECLSPPPEQSFLS